MRAFLVSIVVLACVSCSSEQQATGTAAEFGNCYDARGCPAGGESANSVTKGQCDASGGKSWRGGASGCINL